MLCYVVCTTACSGHGVRGGGGERGPDAGPPSRPSLVAAPRRRIARRPDAVDAAEDPDDEERDQLSSLRSHAADPAGGMRRGGPAVLLPDSAAVAAATTTTTMTSLSTASGARRLTLPSIVKYPDVDSATSHAAGALSSSTMNKGTWIWRKTTINGVAVLYSLFTVSRLK